jgi:predicted nucleotidyltransferase
MEKAEPLKVVINGQEMLAEVKSFSTGSFGWYINGKTTVTVDGKLLSVQIGMNLTVVGSKEAPRE